MNFIEKNENLKYALAVRDNYYLENDPNFEVIIFNGLPMDLIIKEIPEENIIKFIGLAIQRCVQNFNVSKSMNETQIISLAVEWVRAYSKRGSIDMPTIRIEEIITFLELAMTGKYGVPFDHIDSAILQEWFEVYYDIRKNVCFEKFDQGKVKPQERTLNENDALDRRLLTMAGKLGTAKNRIV